MVKESVYLDSYNWKINIYFNFDCQYANEVLEELDELGISKRKLYKAEDDLSACLLNTGLTYSSYINKETIIVIGRTTSAKEFAKTYYHEVGHCATHISQYYHISPYGEEIRYIGQDIVDKSWDMAKKYLCECYRKEYEEETN